jgi:hypothetical protein
VKVESNGAGRPPDYVLKIGIKGERYHRRVGAAWRVKGNGIALRIDAGIALVGAHDISITLWPADEQSQHQTSTDSEYDHE